VLNGKYNYRMGGTESCWLLENSAPM